MSLPGGLAVIRTVAFAALVFAAAASPALAFEHTTIPSPPMDNVAPFVNVSSVMHLAPTGTSEPFRFGSAGAEVASDTTGSKGPMVVYELPKGKPAAYIDVNDPRDNPFMAQPERKAPAAPAQ
jgi:hypothetical protein